MSEWQSIETVNGTFKVGDSVSFELHNGPDSYCEGELFVFNNDWFIKTNFGVVLVNKNYATHIDTLELLPEKQKKGE